MHDRELYRRILGIEAPWQVTDVSVDLPEDGVTVYIGHGDSPLCCPECGAEGPGYDHRERRWRHLDTCQYATWLVAQVPRMRCPEHGVRQVAVPWAEGNSRLTALFEALVIDWLKVATISEVAERLALTWSAVAGVQQRAVARGLKRRALEPPRTLGVDETSFAKRHEYVTVVNDGARVVHVADGRGREALAAWYAEQDPAWLAGLETVAMDMWAPYIRATMDHVPEATAKLAFDKFHIAQHLGQAVDAVRRIEHRRLKRSGDASLARTRYWWLQHPDKLSARRWSGLRALKAANLQTARAWAIKEHAMCLWHYRTRGWARRGWLAWYQWAIRSQLEPVKRVARLVKKHLEGIVTAVVTGAHNARAEGFNALIQKVKRDARGFRNRDRFRQAIYFHLGGLDLYPDSVRS